MAFLRQLYENNAASYISASLGGTSADSILYVVTDDADKFPAPILNEQYFLATLENVQTKEWEIIKVKQRLGNQFSIERNQEGSGVKSFPLGSKIQVRVTKDTLNRLYTRPFELASFMHVQETVSNSWIITHNLERFPSVHIEVGAFIAGEFIKEATAEADITHVSSSSLILTFSEQVVGRAICT